MVHCKNRLRDWDMIGIGDWGSAFWDRVVSLSTLQEKLLNALPRFENVVILFDRNLVFLIGNWYLVHCNKKKVSR